jgi:hypothetical protein
MYPIKFQIFVRPILDQHIISFKKKTSFDTQGHAHKDKLCRLAKVITVVKDYYEVLSCDIILTLLIFEEQGRSV